VNVSDTTFLSSISAGAKVTSAVHEDDAVSFLNSEADVEDDEVLPEATIQVLDELFDDIDDDELESGETASVFSTVSDDAADISVLSSDTA
jgi:hypothetical protein